MKVTLESTPLKVEIPTGFEARLWKGRTESGIPVLFYVAIVGVPDDQDCSEFERELDEQPAPAWVDEHASAAAEGLNIGAGFPD